MDVGGSGEVRVCVVVLSDFYPYNNIASVLIQRSAWNVDQLRGG